MKNIFDKVKIDSKTKLENFSKYVTRRTLTRFLAHNELFKLQLEVQGNIVECGVHHGGGRRAVRATGARDLPTLEDQIQLSALRAKPARA